jgi:hypothetical protein
VQKLWKSCGKAVEKLSKLCKRKMDDPPRGAFQDKSLKCFFTAQAFKKILESKCETSHLERKRIQRASTRKSLKHASEIAESKFRPMFVQFSFFL